MRLEIRRQGIDIDVAPAPAGPFLEDAETAPATGQEVIRGDAHPVGLRNDATVDHYRGRVDMLSRRCGQSIAVAEPLRDLQDPIGLRVGLTELLLEQPFELR